MKYLYSYHLMVPKHAFDVSCDDRKDEEILTRLKNENGNNLVSVTVFHTENDLPTGKGINIYDRNVDMKIDCDTQCHSCERSGK